jgi:hypothetical protein
MKPSRLPGKLLILAVAMTAWTATAADPDITLRATEKGVLLGTSMELGDGSFLIGTPGLITQDVWKPLKPEVRVIDDDDLVLQYPNGAEIAVSLAKSKATFRWTNLPAEVTRLSLGLKIPREAWQGARFSFNEAALEPFPEEEERKNLFEGDARIFTLVDPSGTGFSLAGPDSHFTLANKGPEDWSQFGCSFIHPLKPGVSEFSLEFRSVSAP